MTEIERKAGSMWSGNAKSGTGLISSESQTLFEEPYSCETRFDGDNITSTSPEELIAAAHAACYSMALADTLEKNGYEPKETDTSATITLDKKDGGHEISKMFLHIRADVPNIDNNKFQQLVQEADKNCPVSNLLRNGLKIEIDAVLL
ncbi:MAG: OsmC family peroxiredoxin [Anaerolineales bacterium]